MPRMERPRARPFLVAGLLAGCGVHASTSPVLNETEEVESTDPADSLDRALDGLDGLDALDAKLANDTTLALPCVATVTDALHTGMSGIVFGVRTLGTQVAVAGIVQGYKSKDILGRLALWNADGTTPAWQAFVPDDLGPWAELAVPTSSGVVVAVGETGYETPQQPFLAGFVASGKMAWRVQLPAAHSVWQRGACAVGSRVIAGGSRSDLEGKPFLVAIDADGTARTDFAFDPPLDPKASAGILRVACRDSGQVLGVGDWTNTAAVYLGSATGTVAVVHQLSEFEQAIDAAAAPGLDWYVVATRPDHGWWLLRLGPDGQVVWQRAQFQSAEAVDFGFTADDTGPTLLLSFAQSVRFRHASTSGQLLVDVQVPGDPFGLAAGPTGYFVGGKNADGSPALRRMNPWGQAACPLASACLAQGPASCPQPGECETLNCGGGIPCQKQAAADGTPCTGGRCAAGACIAE